MKRVRITLPPPRDHPAVAATPSPTDDEGWALSFHNALEFMRSVRDTLDRPKYIEFCDTIRQVDSIGWGPVMDRMKVILRGQPNLKRQFNMFLPPLYEFNLMDDDEQEEVSTVDSVQGRPTQRD